MKKANCPNCGKPMESGTLFCPNCGAAVFERELPAETPTKKTQNMLPKLLPIAAVTVAAVIAVALSWDNLAGLVKPSGDHPLSGNSSAPSPSQTTAPSTKATLPPNISGFIPPTQTLPLVLPTETAPPETEPAPTEPDLSWVVTVSQKMSYEEFFSENRPLYGQTNNATWTADDGNTYTINNLLQISRDGAPIYTVPRADWLPENRQLVAADGTHVYIADEYNLQQVDLLTGTIKVSFSLAVPFCAFAPGPDLIYFAGSSPDYLLICRYYIPTQTLDTLYKIDTYTSETWFSLSLAHPYRSLGDVTWTMMNPQMYRFLYDELRNPDSKYRTMEYSNDLDFSEYWKDPRLLNHLPYNMEGVELMRAVYEDTGIQPLLKGTYHCADGSYTEDLGVVDECWFGSGLPHDHWNPEKTEYIPPAIYTSAPTPLPGLTVPTPEMAEQIRSETWSDGNDVFYDCWDNGSGAQRVKNQEGTVIGPPMRFSSNLCNTKFYSYYISTSGSIIRLSLDGAVTEIYTAQNNKPIQWLSYQKGVLVFIEGDTAMALDVVDCTVKPLFSHSGLLSVYWDWDESGKIYFDTCLGLQLDAYLFAPATGTLEETTFRN